MVTQPKERPEKGGETALSKEVFPEVAQHLAPGLNAQMDLGGVEGEPATLAGLQLVLHAITVC